MFAIVKLGNQQFKVKAGDFIRAPFQNHPPSSSIDLPVLAFGDGEKFAFDSSQLKKSKVKALVVRQSLGPKILVFKKKRRKGYRRTRGHRQKVTELQILELKSPEGRLSKLELKKKASAKPAPAGVQKAPKDKAMAETASAKPQEAKAPASKSKSSHKKVKKTALKAAQKAKETKAQPVKEADKTENSPKKKK